MSIWKFANPNIFLKWSTKVIPICAGTALILLVVGLVWGGLLTPEDFRQGTTVKILFVHVPSAFLAINIYFMMFMASLIWLIKRHHVSALAAKAAAPIGVSMTLIALATGAIWGQPMWGTPWVWDPRLTSFAVMLIFYISYIALWSTVNNRDKAADLSSILCLTGSVFAVLSRYAVNFWDKGLHQGASLSLDKEEHISNEFFFPLLVCMGGFVCLFLTLVLIRTQTEIRNQRIISLLRTEGFNK
ncbi:MAG: heme ABC transporter permease CcmC [Paracoccaceae bacterium]|nr:heme ABC transporter permease CcmC [Paracoccaceae bacterium]